jgi:hypothetical protein
VVRLIQDLTGHIISLENRYNELKLFQDNERAAWLLKVQELQGSQDPSILIANNDMIKFYLQGACLVSLGVGALFILSQWIPAPFALSWKAVIPTKIYFLLQNYTPFFQTRKTYVD